MWRIVYMVAISSVAVRKNQALHLTTLTTLKKLLIHTLFQKCLMLTSS